ncbi:hypothetical protein [Dyadobacter luticola]|uniref:Uncharacterized protein n=1 Tax=Dyadobacter luticola TaxID=1979387 RepID=A0A5R9L1S3_9BACT|nr:hypothetical protein [Dyadobacter luticola]TLV02230.1 hypothetical protein FEN17_00900 [Dyadobacter luticola]
MYKCLNNVNPNVEEVRLWAYDEDVLFTEQDEDLILYDYRYVPILMELASDPTCPKDHYCLTILVAYGQSQLAGRVTGAINEIEKCIRQFNGPVSSTVKQWQQDFMEMSGLISRP